MNRFRAGVPAVACMLALGLTACGGDDSSDKPATSSGGSVSKAAGIGQAAIDFGVKATAGKDGKADTSLAPVTFGFINQEGGSPSFPEQTAAADAAVSFVNGHLGGIQGHPLKLQKCNVASEEDGQKCGSEMVNAKLPLVNQALIVVGNDSLHKTIGTRIPTLITSPTGASDFTAKNAYTMSGGTGAIVNAYAADSARLKVKTVALLGVNNPAGKFATNEILAPLLDKAGVKHGKPILFGDSASTPDMVSALQAAGASKADAVAFLPSGPANCTSIWDGMKQLGLKKPVITTLLCNADSFVEHTGSGPEGWDVITFNNNPRVEGDSDVKVFSDVMKAYGKQKYITAGFAVGGFADVLLMARFGNEIGPDAITPETMAKEIAGFKGPAPYNPSDIACGYDAKQPTLCGNAVLGSRFEGGKWTSVGAFKLGGGS